MESDIVLFILNNVSIYRMRLIDWLILQWKITYVCALYNVNFYEREMSGLCEADELWV